MTYGIRYAKASYRDEHGYRVLATRVLADSSPETEDAFRRELNALSADGYVHLTVTNVTSTDDIATVTCGYWFRPDTKRSFGSRILSGQRIIGHKFYFVSSEWTGFDRAGRAYSVRVWDADSDSIDTVGEFGQYSNGSQARRALERL